MCQSTRAESITTPVTCKSSEKTAITIDTGDGNNGYLHLIICSSLWSLEKIFYIQPRNIQDGAERGIDTSGNNKVMAIFCIPFQYYQFIMNLLLWKISNRHILKTRPPIRKSFLHRFAPLKTPTKGSNHVHI